MKAVTRAVMIALLLVPLAASAVGGVAEASFDRDWEPALDAVAAKDWRNAVALLKGVAARDPGNAEVHNQLGFAYRQARDLDNAFVHYREALRLSPKHLGAHEYIGEAYLMRGDVAMARTHLRRLEEFCGRDCDEYKDLAKAIAQAQ